MEQLPRLENTGLVSIGEYNVPRLALGAMRLLSSDVVVDGRTRECRGGPTDPDASRAMLKAAIDHCGIGYIDFARGYGATPDAAEQWFREWMAPYPEGLLWATKVGYDRDPDGAWVLNLDPHYLRRELAQSLSILGTPIPLCYLIANSTLDVLVRNRPRSLEESLRPFLEAQQRGDLRHLGLANVSARELETLAALAPISVVQNKFTVASLADPAQRDVLELCRQLGIPFVAWGVFQSDDESPWVPGEALEQAARELEMSAQDTSISVLLQACPHLVVLTGASRPTSLAASVRAASRTVPENIVRRFQAHP